MATYDNKHWLLSHIRNSFIFSDDTGICEAAMGGENIAHQLNVSQYECYPGVDGGDDEEESDVLGQSYDLHADSDFCRRITGRYRSNTAVRLQKMEEERRIQASIRHVHWDKPPLTLTGKEMAELFPKKTLTSNTAKTQPHSLLSEIIQNHPTLPANPFRDYAKFNGDSQWGAGVRCFKIWLTMLNGEKRNFPMQVSVMATARVLDLIGLVCWRCMAEYSLSETALKESVDYYSLHIAEDDGEVDWDFPCLDNRESVTKFTFNFLALVERDPKQEPPDKHATSVVIKAPNDPQIPRNRERVSESEAEKKQGDIDARIRAPMYESFKVYMLNKVRAKTEVHLGVSADKVEIFPVVQQRVSAKFFGRLKASTHDMDSVVACDLVDTKSNNRATFRLVYDHSTLSASLDSSSSSSPVFKNHDFEATTEVANLIVQKINHILELKPSTRRKEYLTHREHKSHRRKSFHLGPR
ncbi:target of rapamycin complex 2 subunit MAPKAP1 [Macrosteles quadrilineatus]|uniref:target of rapamycin complex 2 subunit MAPKAP1 n=1 Tax=Macrosteles quadrilineatus TaxID=74068 RepID=UPI0023E34062|nr:target of rapamycin complex 2 subunit MAPKAP1 [Macrosteles quadrilineatus]